MSIKDDFAQCRDEDNLIQNTLNPPPHNGSGNGIRYTSEEAIILFKIGELDQDTKNKIEEAFQRCQEIPGLIKRSPTHTDQQGPDDIVAAASYGSTCNQPLADSILSYGRDNPVKFGPFKIPYVYNNVRPGTFKKPNKDDPSKEVFNGSAILLRQPQVIIHLKVSAKVKINLLEKIYWCVAVAFNGFSKPEDQDGWMLTSHLVNSYGNSPYRNYFMDKACKIWYTKFKKSPYKTFANLISAYFGFPHPISKGWDEVFKWIEDIK